MSGAAGADGAQAAGPSSGPGRGSWDEYPSGWVRPTPLWDESQVVPALMRQEAEGGVLLISALGRCMRDGTIPDTLSAFILSTFFPSLGEMILESTLSASLIARACGHTHTCASALIGI